MYPDSRDCYVRRSFLLSTQSTASQVNDVLSRTSVRAAASVLYEDLSQSHRASANPPLRLIRQHFST